MANEINRRTTNMLLKHIFNLVVHTITAFFKKCLDILTNKYTRDVLWTISEICITVAMFIVLSLATCYMSIIINVNEAMKSRKKQEIKPGDTKYDDKNKLLNEKTQNTYKLKGIPEEKNIEQLVC